MSVLCAVLDKKARLGLKPFFDDSIEQAQRGFTLLANEIGSPVNAFPDDYALVQLANYSPDGMVLSVLDPPSIICQAADIIRTEPFPAANLHAAELAREVSAIRAAFETMSRQISSSRSDIKSFVPFYKRIFQ